MPVTGAQSLIGTEENPDAGILINYDDDEYIQGYSQIKEAFRARTKDYILQTYKLDHDFSLSNASADDVGYILYVFDIWYQKNYTASQQFK